MRWWRSGRSRISGRSSGHTADGLWYDLVPGPKGAETILLSAGLGGSANFWAPQMAALTARFNVLLYDHRGTGRSVRTLTEPHSVDAMAADMRSVMDAAKVKTAHVMGHAAGGLAGLVLALKSPKRVGKLVVVNGWSRPDPHIARCFEARIALLKKSGKRAYVRAQPLFLYPASWISENTAQIEAEEEHMVKGFPSTDVMLARIEALLAFDIDAKLPKIAAPVLVIAYGGRHACAANLLASLGGAAAQCNARGNELGRPRDERDGAG